MSTALAYLAGASLLVACGSPRHHPSHVDACDAASARADHHHRSAVSTGDVEPLAIPDAATDGPSIQPQVLATTPNLKVMSIRLRGVELPPHSSEVPVVIAAATGSGTVVIGERRVRVDATHAVALAPRVKHAVVPDPGDDLVLLVTHALGGQTQ